MVNEQIGKNIFGIFEENILWTDRQLFMMGTSLTDIQPQTPQAIETTLRVGSKLTANIKNDTCIDISGKKQTGRFRKVIQHIMLMVTLMIIDLRILALSLIKNIWDIIINIQQKNVKEKCTNSLSWQETKQQTGIDQKTAGNGIVNTLMNLYIKRQNIQQLVLNVIRNLKRDYGENQNIVVDFVKTDLIQDDHEKPGNTQKAEYAYNVTRYFKPISGVKIFTAPVNVCKTEGWWVEPVYDISVEGEHEYFANGILVHNCEYLAVELFSKYY